MSTLLYVNGSSLSASSSFSRQVAASFLDEYQGDVVTRDLAVNPTPHLNEAGITSRYAPRETSV